MTRRQFIKSAAFASLAVLASPRVLAGFQSCIVNRKTVFLRGLDPEYDGIRVALLTDFHHGPLVTAQRIRNSVKLANSLNPDLIALARVFVTTGVGHSFPPIRMNCPAEVALLTLRRGASPPDRRA